MRGVLHGALQESFVLRLHRHQPSSKLKLTGDYLISYTGAPYFSAMASARLGLCSSSCILQDTSIDVLQDVILFVPLIYAGKPLLIFYSLFLLFQSYVICEPSASQTIKSYSPNLMVSPLLRSSKTLAVSHEDPSVDEMTSPILDLLPRLHVLVIGPGLGRDEITLKQVATVIKAARKQEPPVPLVLDADGLFLINSDPDLIKGYTECILTPNVVEFGRLVKSLGVNVDDGDRTKDCEKLAKALGGVCIIQKGKDDYISNGKGTTTCDFKGGLKRSGGQGDTLTGSLGTFLAWRQIYHEGLWDGAAGEDKMSRSESLLAAAFGGSAITRECSRKAFEKNGRSLQASDLTDEVHGSFLTLIGEPEGGSTL